MSQSSIEFYIHNLIDILGDDVCNKLTIDQTNKIHNLGNQAAEMHKQEIMDAWYNGFEENRPYVDHSEDYYNEKFNNNE